MSKRNSTRGIIGFTLVATLGLTGCSSPTSSSITIGINNFFASLDPANTYSLTDSEIMFQVYGSLFTYKPGSSTPVLELAQDSGFLDDDTLRVSIKPGLKFSNGHDLSATDVIHSINRVRTIDSALSPGILLSNIESLELVDDLTIDINLKVSNDQTIQHVLASTAALIVDEETFPADKVLENDAILETQPFAGQYLITALANDEYIALSPNPRYQGALSEPKNTEVLVRYFSDPNNLLLASKNGEIDVAVGWRSLGEQAVRSLQEDDFELKSGPGAEPNYLSFVVDNQPFGSATKNPNASKALAVRQAIAYLIDREALASDSYFDAAQPAYSMVPELIPGYYDAFKQRYDVGSDPNLRKAAAKDTLASAGVSDQVEIEIQYATDRYGPTTELVVRQIADQLEASELFSVSLRSFEWSAFRDARNNGELSIFHATWGPDFPEADNYLTPLYRSDLGSLRGGYVNADLDDLLLSQLVESDPLRRLELLKQIQTLSAEEVPAIPFLQTSRFALIRPGVNLEEGLFDVTFRMRYGLISK